MQWGCFCLLVLFSAATMFCMWSIEFARSNTCSHHLKLLGLTLQNYCDRTGSLPPAYDCDETGKPINSWRTRIVPGVLWYNFPKNYDFSQPWNGPTNFALLGGTALSDFNCPSDVADRTPMTSYVAVVGPNTMWPGCTGAKPAADGSDDDKILVIEVVHSNIQWTEPRDLTLDEALDTFERYGQLKIGSQHRDGIHYVTVGGMARTLDPNIDRESLRKLLVREPKNVPSSDAPVHQKESTQ